MTTHLTGHCFYCGKKKEEHYTLDVEEGMYAYLCDFSTNTEFLDSGEKLLHDKAPELLKRAREYKDVVERGCKVKLTYAVEYLEKFKALESLIDEITKNK